MSQLSIYGGLRYVLLLAAALFLLGACSENQPAKVESSASKAKVVYYALPG